MNYECALYFTTISTLLSKQLKKSIFTVQIYIVLEIDDNDAGTTTTSICYYINFINSKDLLEISVKQCDIG